MPFLTLPIVEQGLRLLNNIIEMNREDPTATAKWLTAFWIFWPLAKFSLTQEQEDQIEALVKAIKVPAVEPPKP